MFNLLNSITWRRALVVCLLLTAAAVAGGNEFRTWTSKEGSYRKEAKLIEAKTNEVLLEDRSGKRITVPLDKLSDSDRQFVADNKSAKQTPQAQKQKLPSTAREALAWIESEGVRPEFEQSGEFKGSAASVKTVALSSGGDFLLACGSDGDCRVWDLKAGKQLGQLREKLPGNPESAAITADGKRALVGCEQGGIRLWMTATGKFAGSYDAPKAAVSHLALVGDEKTVVAVDRSPAIHRFVLAGKSPPTILDDVKTKGFGLAACPPNGNVVGLGQKSERKLELQYFEGVIAKTRGIVDITTERGPPSTLAVSDETFAYTNDRLIVQPHLRSFEDRARFFQLDMQISTPEHLHLTPDGRFAFAVAGEGHVEIWDTLVDQGNRQGKIDCTGKKCIAFSHDGQVIAVGRNDGSTVAWRLKALPEHGAWRMKEWVLDCLVNEKYDLLDALGDELAQVTDPFPWASERSKYGQYLKLCVQKIGAPREAQEDDRLVVAWRKSRPDSVHAKLAEVHMRRSEAWDSRGGGYANTVTEAGWRGFKQKLDEAKKVLLPILETEEKVPLEAYALLIDIAKAESWEEEQLKPYTERLEREGLEYFSAHDNRAQMLMPRWGGNPEDTEAYTRRIADKIGGEKGDILYARIACDISRYYPTDTFFQQTFFDNDRVNRGLELIAKQSPVEWQMVNFGLRMAAAAKSQQRAALFAKVLREDEEFHRDPSIWPRQEDFDVAIRWAEGTWKP